MVSGEARENEGDVCANPSPAELQKDVDILLVFKEAVELDYVLVVQSLVYLYFHCHLRGRGGEHGGGRREGVGCCCCLPLPYPFDGVW